MSEQQQQVLKITPTLDQWNRFIIWHNHTYCAGSKHRMEEFARQLVDFEKEYSETGSITLTDEYMIEDWNGLALDNFVIDDDYDIQQNGVFP
jgi:hypothetical protein